MKLTPQEMEVALVAIVKAYSANFSSIRGQDLAILKQATLYWLTPVLDAIENEPVSQRAESYRADVRPIAEHYLATAIKRTNPTYAPLPLERIKSMLSEEDIDEQTELFMRLLIAGLEEIEAYRSLEEMSKNFSELDIDSELEKFFE